MRLLSCSSTHRCRQEDSRVPVMGMINVRVKSGRDISPFLHGGIFRTEKRLLKVPSRTIKNNWDAHDENVWILKIWMESDQRKKKTIARCVWSESLFCTITVAIYLFSLSNCCESISYDVSIEIVNPWKVEDEWMKNEYM